jgi:fumarylacetoacetase
MRPVDETHHPDRRSWVESANREDSGFPVQNLPFCRFERPGLPGRSGIAIGTGIGDSILDLAACAREGFFSGELSSSLLQPTLAGVMALDVPARIALRRRISDLLRESGPDSDRLAAMRDRVLVTREDVRLLLPVEVGDYTDFYASVFHATNVGSMFRPDNPLLPNYKYVPIGYHGRASSLVPDGTPVRRPQGQTAPATEGDPPVRQRSQQLDYELEVGFYVGPGNRLGETISIERAEDHLFGMSLVNDWSARDIQRWEYQPLGPFLAKSFATTVSPWVVTMEALAPFRCQAYSRPQGDPEPLPYLLSDTDRRQGGIDLRLAVFLSSRQMREQGKEPVELSRGTFRDMYWTPAQMLTHHASNGCNLRTGDLIASGTVSNQDRHSRGCLLELTWDGGPGNPLPGNRRTPIVLPTDERRSFLEDGDEVFITGWCEAPGRRRIGLGECRGIILPADA